MKKILSFRFKNQSLASPKPCFGQARLWRSKALESGLTMIELLVGMVIIAILATLGSRAYYGVQETARLSATIDEMKNIVELVAKLENRLGGQIGGAWDATPTFPVAGTIRELNASQTFINLPDNNKFSSKGVIEYDYFFTITPTIKVSTTIPLADISPPGFISSAVNSGATSTILTVYPRPKIIRKTLHRRKWVDNFYYKQEYKELKEKQKANPGRMLPNHTRGKYVPE